MAGQYLSYETPWSQQLNHRRRILVAGGEGKQLEEERDTNTQKERDTCSRRRGETARGGKGHKYPKVEGYMKQEERGETAR
jgi:hypothetical protein